MLITFGGKGIRNTYIKPLGIGNTGKKCII